MDNVHYTLMAEDKAVHCISSGKPWQTRCGKDMPEGTEPLDGYPKGHLQCASCFRYSALVFHGRKMTGDQKLQLREYIQTELQRFLRDGGLIKRLPPEELFLKPIIGGRHGSYVNPIRGNDSTQG